MIDFAIGWRAVPGFWSVEDALVFQKAVKMAPPGTAVVETGAWCGRSLASACEVLPPRVEIHSYDNYLEDSQAAQATNGSGSDSPITPQVAMRLRELVKEHYGAAGKKVFTHVQEAAQGGREYSGPLVSVLMIDDHHSFEQVNANLDAWLVHCNQQCVLLFHDYRHPPYRIFEACEARLPVANFRFVGQQSGSGLGVWIRGF